MSETTPDPADFHTGTDRVELTDDECESIWKSGSWPHVGTDLIRAVESIVAARTADLRRWKSEAIEVLYGLQELGKALDLPLGERITGPKAVEAVQALTAERDELRAANGRIFDDGLRYKAERDTARAEVAELRKSLDYWVELWKKAANGVIGLQADLSEARAELASANARCAELEAIAERNGVRWCACSRAARRRDEANPACPLHGEPMVQQRNALQETLDRVTAVLASVEAINDGGWQPMVENILTKIGTDLRAALTPEGTE